MKLNIKRSILILSILSILFLSIAMVSASDISADSSDIYLDEPYNLHSNVIYDGAGTDGDSGNDGTDIEGTDGDDGTGTGGTDGDDGTGTGGTDGDDGTGTDGDGANDGEGPSTDERKSSNINYELNNTVYYGEDVNIYANLTDEEGNLIDENFKVSVFNDVTDLIMVTLKGHGTITIPASSFNGNEFYDVEFNFNGTEEYAPSVIYTNFEVISRENTNVVLDSYPDSSKINSTKFIFTLMDENGNVINDTVDIYTNEEYSTSILTNGDENEVVLSNLNLGENTILIKYNGSDKYNGSENSFDVIGYEKETNLLLDAPDVLVGNNAQITLNLTDDDGNIVDGEIIVTVEEEYYGEEGYVPFSDEYLVIGKGTIIIHQSKLAEGKTYYVRAKYDGNLTHSSSIAYDYFTCQDRGTEIEIDGRLTSDDEDVVLKIALFDKIEEMIAGEINLTVFDNESNPVVDTITVNTNEDDFVEVNLGKLPFGHYKINASFAGNDKYNATELEDYLHVFKAVDLNIEASDVLNGESQTVNFTLFADDLGLNETAYLTIFNLKNKPYYDGEINFTDGKASFELDNITEDLIIYVYYDNEMDLNGPFVTVYESAYRYASIRVLENTVVNATIEMEPDGKSIVASLKDLDGSPIANAPVSVNVSGEVSNLTTDDNGQVKIDDIPNNSTVEVKYTDSNNLEASSKILVLVNELVKSRDATKIECNNMNTVAVAKPDGRIGEYFNVNLTDGSGNPLANKEVKIGFNGVVYNRTTNETGGVRLQINLGYTGLYTFAICFLGDEDYNASYEVCVINVSRHTPKLTASAKTYKASAKTKSLTATFKTANGNAISGKSLVFIVDGKLYNAKTNSKGVATVKVSISKKGTYSCTVRSTEDGMYAATSTKFNVKIT